VPDTKLARTAQPINELLARRWSPRAIDPLRRVAHDHVVVLLEAARWAPSCSGDEPWRYLAWDRFENPAGWQRAWECLSPGNQYWVKNAPVLLASFADSQFRNGKPNRWGQHDTGAASENLCLQGTALGLVVHQMGGFDGARLAGAFDVPEQFTPMAMIAVGHPGDPGGLSDKHQAAEAAPRERQPFGELFFDGAWGKPLLSTRER
jgi:nitroreductase